VTIVRQASGLVTGTSFTATLPAASSSSNRVVCIFAGNTTVTTPTGWTLRTSQVNQMGHYLWDRAGGAASYAFTNSNGQGTWWIAEFQGNAYDTSTSANATASLNTYNTPNLTPAAGTRILVASLGSLTADSPGVARTLSGWTNGFVEQADLCQPTADYPMQGVAVLDNTAVNGTTVYSTTGTYSGNSVGRSAIIASYLTTGTATPTAAAYRRVGKRR
jgi:hypothetical protein